MLRKKSATQLLYERYAYLAESYSYKLFNLDKISFDRDDVKQELRIKLYKAIIAYGHRWAQYKRTGKYKPVPINIFLRKCMNNMVIDLGKQTTRQPNIMCSDSYEVDYGAEDGAHVADHEVSLPEKKMIINGFDLLEGLDQKEKGCFMLFTRGFPIAKLNKLYRNHLNAEELIARHLTKLRNDWCTGIDKDGNKIYSGELFQNLTRATFLSFSSLREE